MPMVSSLTSLVSAGAPHSLRITADEPAIGAGEDDLSYLTVEVLDAHGVLCDQTALRVDFSVSGSGELFRVGSGDPVDTASFTANHRKTWRGRAVAVVRPKLAASGTITVSATAEGLVGASAEVQVGNSIVNTQQVKELRV